MMTEPLFLGTKGYNESALTLPVVDIDVASAYYCKAFGMSEVKRSESLPTVILSRDGVELGFQINGGDAGNDGAEMKVADAEKARAE